MAATEDKSASLIAVTAAMISVMVVSLLIRFYTRIFIVKWVGLDDTLALIAGLFALVEGLTAVVGKCIAASTNFLCLIQTKARSMDSGNTTPNKSLNGLRRTRK
jgi:hypothetical protein